MKSVARAFRNFTHHTGKVWATLVESSVDRISPLRRKPLIHVSHSEIFIHNDLKAASKLSSYGCHKALVEYFVIAERSAQSQHEFIYCSEFLVVWPSRITLIAIPLFECQTH